MKKRLVSIALAAALAIPIPADAATRDFPRINFGAAISRFIAKFKTPKTVKALGDDPAPPKPGPPQPCTSNCG